MDSPKPITPNLFEPQPLLENRLGAERFEAIPQKPGVYRFYDASGELLYVGKAKNLRRRLFSYKRAVAGKVSRKVARLISRISEMVWVETESEQEALLLENRMIRGDRPPFNHANKEPETYYFVYLKPDEKSGLEFRLAMRIHEETEESYWYGCFKGHRLVRQSFGCLLRLLWMAEHNVSDPMFLPVQLSRNLTPMRYRLLLSDHSHNPGSKQRLPSDLIHFWITGESCEILDWFVVQIECGKKLPLFHRLHIENHLEILKHFYDTKLVPHRSMRGEKTRIEQDEVDDMIILNHPLLS
tara:strand:+ start:52221 stop:53114 length:894 start_codon:yes stop_codon:yes gene_type:complete